MRIISIIINAMMSEYFPHDYKARYDDKLVRLSMRHGLAGIGAYWCIVEILYECNGYVMRTECERIAYELRTALELIESVIFDFGLFEYDDKKGVIYSHSILRRIEHRKAKSDKARASASARWGSSERNANALQTECERNANKIKVKEKENIYNNIISEHQKIDDLINEIEQDERWQKIILEWLAYKRERKQTYKPAGAKKFVKQLKELSSNNPDVAQRIIDQSIAQNYSGIFPLKDVPQKKVSSLDFVPKNGETNYKPSIIKLND